MHELAEAIREVTVRMQEALDEGRRSLTLDANDLIDILLAVADELDPPWPKVEGPTEA